MKKLAIAFILTAAVASGSSAKAEVLGLVTTPAGSLTNSIGAAVAKVLTEKANLRTTVQPQQSLGQEPVNSGAADLSIANSFDTRFYVTGTGEYAGNGEKKNLRMISRMTTLYGIVMVQKDSPIKSIADLRGKRIGSDFGAQKTIQRVWEAYLANSGLSYKDVTPVAARNGNGAADDFASGKTDAFMFSLGSAKVKQVAARVDGLRVLPINTDAKAVKAMREYLPGSFPLVVDTTPNQEEVRGPTPVIAYDMVLFTNAMVPEDTVYNIAKTLHDNKAALEATFKPMANFKPNHMNVDYEGLQYHPGAIKFFKESGNWPAAEVGG